MRLIVLHMQESRASLSARYGDFLFPLKQVAFEILCSFNFVCIKVAIYDILCYTFSPRNHMGVSEKSACMKNLHNGIVLRASSVYKGTITLFDDQLGKIEGIAGRSVSFSHGALISYTLQKRATCYYLQDMKLLEMPLEWARENFLFFHHVLELCDYFVPWDVHCEALFKLVYFLYTNPASVDTKDAQKLFLTSFFKRVGIHPEQGSESLEDWLQACINAHPQVLLFRTAGFLKTLEVHEEAA